jgi:hypothetical protein
VRRPNVFAAFPQKEAPVSGATACEPGDDRERDEETILEPEHELADPQCTCDLSALGEHTHAKRLASCRVRPARAPAWGKSLDRYQLGRAGSLSAARGDGSVREHGVVERQAAPSAP